MELKIPVLLFFFLTAYAEPLHRYPPQKISSKQWVGIDLVFHGVDTTTLRVDHLKCMMAGDGDAASPYSNILMRTCSLILWCVDEN